MKNNAIYISLMWVMLLGTSTTAVLVLSCIDTPKTLTRKVMKIMEADSSEVKVEVDTLKIGTMSCQDEIIANLKQQDSLEVLGYQIFKQQYKLKERLDTLKARAY